MLQKKPLKDQEALFLDLILNNKNISEILDKGFLEEFRDWYLVAGCLNQTIWNQLSGFDITNSIKDYDLIYFDSDLSFEKEEGVKTAINNKYAYLPLNIDVVNQARVHLWTEKDMGFEMKPLNSCEEAIASWPITATCIGVRKENSEYIIMAPYGLTDSLEMVIRPNKTTVMGEPQYRAKISKWVKKWPNLTVIPW